jgi:hypothetical protein
MTWAGVVLLTFALVALGVAGAMIVGLGCGENVTSGTARADVCAAVGEPGDATLWLFASPALVFAAVALVGGRRGPLYLVWAAALTVLVAADGILLAIVTDNL